MENRAESLAAGEGSLSSTPDESPEGNPTAEVEPAADGKEESPAADGEAESPEATSSPVADRTPAPVAERAAPVADRTPAPVAERAAPVAERAAPVAERDAPAVPDWTPRAEPAGSPAYASNGAAGIDKPSPDKADVPASAPSATAPLPSLMSAAPSPAGGGPSIQDSAAAAVTSAANGAKGVASKISTSFSSLTKPRPRRPKQAARTQMPPRRPSMVAGGIPPRAQPSYQPSAGPRTAPGGPPPRSAMLSLQRVEPLSVMKFSFLVSLIGWVVVFVAVAIIWFTLSKLGVFAKIEQTVGLVTYTKDHPGSNAASWFSASRVLGYTALVCTINAILFTALATIGAALYNLVTSLTGGIEVTLKETD